MSAWWVTEDEVVHPDHLEGGPRLWLQKGVYNFTDRDSESGVRLVWRLDTGKIQARGPARVDSLDDIEMLVALARGRIPAW